MTVIEGVVLTSGFAEGLGILGLLLAPPYSFAERVALRVCVVSMVVLLGVLGFVIVAKWP